MKKILVYLFQKHRWWTLGTIALLALLIWWFLPKKQTVTYEYVPVKRGNLVLTTEATGSVVPEHRLEVKAPLAGRVESIEVDQGQNVKQGQVLAWVSSSERATLMDAARAMGTNEVAYWKDIYKPAPLVAPLDGLIIARNIVPGQVVTTDTTLFVMSDRLIVQAYMDETDLAKTAVDQRAKVTLDAWRDTHFGGKVSRIAYDATTTNNVTTYKVDVQFDEIKDYVRSGMSASISFERDHRTNVLIIPVNTISNNIVLFVPPKGGSFQQREIKPGVSDGKFTEILSGLAENDQVARISKNKKTKKALDLFSSDEKISSSDHDGPPPPPQ